MKQINIISLVLIFFGSIGINTAQVTIGAGVMPAKGAILDIKSQNADHDNITSKLGGVVMPRLKLVNINTLQPFISNTDPDLASLKKSHIGLMVYNLTNNDIFKPGLYTWDGGKWEMTISEPKTIPDPISVVNGLTLSSASQIELGGTLNTNTAITQNNNTLQFDTGDAKWSVNNTDFVVKEGSIGIGKTPRANQKLDVAGDAQMKGNLTVEGATSLKSLEITGTATNPSSLVYAPNNESKENRFLIASNSEGLAKWQRLGGLTSLAMNPVPSSALSFNPNDANSLVNYYNTGLSIELPRGKYMISYSVRMVSTSINSSSTVAIKPTSFRFTMLDNGEPLPVNGKKPYDDCRAYPDTHYNSCTGFFVVENTEIDSKTYYLAVKTQELGLNWPGNVQLINPNKKDAYIVAFLMGDN